jgi:rare lipoprotein A
VHLIIKSLLITLFILSTFTTSAFSKDRNILAYKDRGIKYYPRYIKKGTVKYGKASWYGKPFHGRLTANGERYNMYNMTAAHRTYAMGTILKVTNLKNKRSVRVRVNDRGPFYSSRMIDLSYGAAKRLGIVKQGIGRIKIQVVSSKKRAYSKKRYKSSKKRVTKKRITKRPISKKKISKKRYVSKKVLRNKKIQVASFFSKSHANSFKKKHKLNNVIIVKKYISKYKKNAYRVVIKCTNFEAKKLLKSKKFNGAYKV